MSDASPVGMREGLPVQIYGREVGLVHAITADRMTGMEQWSRPNEANNAR